MKAFGSKEILIETMREVCAAQPFMNCRLFVQLMVRTPELEKLRVVKKAKVGDILQWGEKPARHWAVFLGDGDVLEVPEWGAKARVSKLGALTDEYGNPDYIRRVP